jgi:hypothetical protein
MLPIISRGFSGRRRHGPADRLPPGQYRTYGVPVLSVEPTAHTPVDVWDFSIVGELDEPRRWTWEEFRALASEEVMREILGLGETVLKMRYPRGFDHPHDFQRGPLKTELVE